MPGEGPWKSRGLGHGVVPAVVIGVFALGLSAPGKLLAIAPAALGALLIVTCWLPSFSHRMTLPTP